MVRLRPGSVRVSSLSAKATSKYYIYGGGGGRAGVAEKRHTALTIINFIIRNKIGELDSVITFTEYPFYVILCHVLKVRNQHIFVLNEITA